MFLSPRQGERLGEGASKARATPSPYLSPTGGEEYEGRSHSAFLKVMLNRRRPVRGCAPSFSASTPWNTSRVGPPHTTTSPCCNGTLVGVSLRLSPPNWKVAGRPSDTETTGWP